ncbi:hypothetical protein ACP70R_028430 [Stipagrostis hirtigluma subsp. patula]
MDATLGSKSAPPAAQQQAEPSPADATAVVVAGVQTSGAEDNDDDEQVERFYALLDNIRAMRGMFRTDDGKATPGATGRRKRTRGGAEPAAWRPAFRMEDFEVEDVVNGDAAGHAGKETGSGDGAVARQPPAGSETEAVAGDVEEGDVVEANFAGCVSRRVARRGVDQLAFR